ncbi:hypothetical protein BMS3Abin07_01004 [bacterium BMS3Abin07]|nr:hypothetical protein BMS3Abin07_01004 [bacterium BMS3Abin07]GBE33006.1 hypothetical protein BMS3Bbin05_01938 [bacterium BMS3Bbin05]
MKLCSARKLEWFGGYNIIMDGKKRLNITQGLKVKIVLKQDQKSGKLTEGVVKDILTNSPSHPHGIKVRLDSGDVGRVKEICR